MIASANLQDDYRFVVSTCNLRPDWPASIDQPFTNRADAEAFAEAISHYLVPNRPGEPPVQWVLVYALAVDLTVEFWNATGGSYCYLAFDPGGVVVKKHEIPDGYGPGDGSEVLSPARMA